MGGQTCIEKLDTTNGNGNAIVATAILTQGVMCIKYIVGHYVYIHCDLYPLKNTQLTILVLLYFTLRTIGQIR